MERQSADIRLKCANCGEPAQSCICAAAATISLSDRPVQPGYAAPSSAQPYLVATKSCSSIGSIVGNCYELVAELGSGGMGTVFKARHINLPKFFAIKILKPELSNDPDFRARFEQEAKTASLLNHPHLVAIYDYGATDYGEAFLVMDFIDGQSLADALNTLKRIEQKQAVKVFAQICEGLTHAHGLGVIHRDLKPGNVMLVNTREATDVVKVVDFGIAKMVGADGSIAHITQSLTKTGEFFGSPLYMSPEQGNGGHPDQRTDIYSLGILMYECLTSAPPFRGDNFFFTMMLHNEAQPKPFEKALGVPEDLEKIVFKALEKNPDHRYQSMEEMRLALLSALGDDIVVSMVKKGSGKSVSKRPAQVQHATPNEPESAKPKSAFALLAASLTAILIIVGACAYWFLDHKKTAPSPPIAKATSAPLETLPAALEALAPSNLPAIPDSVKLPETAKNLTAQELVSAGQAVAEANQSDYLNLMPARYFTTAAIKDPGLDNAYTSLLSFYWKQQEHAPNKDQNTILEKCVAVYKEQIKHNPKNVDTYDCGSAAYQYLHRWPDVLVSTAAGLDVSPENATLHVRHAYALSEMGRKSEAIPEFEKYMRSSDVGAMYVLGTCYEDTNEYEKAIAFASKWLKKLGPEAGLLMVKADSEKELKRYKNALKDYEELVHRWPNQLAARGGAIEECKKMIASQKQN